MNAIEFLKQHHKIVNNHVVLGPIEEKRCCQHCFESGEVVDVTFDSKQNGWVCEKGHFGPNQKLATGTVVHGPNW